MTYIAIPEYLKPHLKHRLLTAVEERTLLVASQSGDLCARSRLQRFNLRLLVAKAKAFHKSYPHLDFDELFDACFEGLNKGISEFDLSQDVRLITFAHWKILHQMQEVSRQESRETESRCFQPIDEFEVSVDPTPLTSLECQESVVMLRQKRRQIWKALQSFPKWIRKLIVWRLLGRTFAWIGERFGYTGQTISNYFKKYFPQFRRRLHPQAYKFQQSPQLKLRSAAVRPTRVVKRQSTLLPLLTLVQSFARRALRVLARVVRSRMSKPKIRHQAPLVFSLVATVVFAFAVFCSSYEVSVVEPAETCIPPPKGVVYLKSPRPPTFLGQLSRIYLFFSSLTFVASSA